MSNEQPRIDLLVNAPGPWAEVRVGQPFQALAAAGWDVKVQERPLDLEQCRPDSLVIWQRPLPQSWEQCLAAAQLFRQNRCLWLLEWDDHPDLFSAEIRARFVKANHAHLRLPQAIQTSSACLAKQLHSYHPHVLVVENAVDPVPPLNLVKHEPGRPLRVFLGNINREREHRALAHALLAWLADAPHLTVVTAGPSGLEGLLPRQRLEAHPALPYGNYRQLLASCQLALLPLERSMPNRCKTAIKWQECAAESVAVVAGPELYGPWLACNRYGLEAISLDELVPLARRLATEVVLRRQLVAQAHGRVHKMCLAEQLPWRMELYRHLWRIRSRLAATQLERWPTLEGI